MALQGVVTLVRPVPGIKMKSSDQEAILVFTAKSKSDKEVLEIVDQAA